MTAADPPQMRLYNTLTRRVADFVPIEPGKVRLYCCGPTVYDYPHIGNFRTYLFEDTLRRTLEAVGYEVRHVMNVTDVGHLTDDADQGEDKMLKGARREGKTVWEVAAFYTEQFFSDADALNILRPHVVAKATDHIDEMIALIGRLEQRGFAYVADGNVYFDVKRFERYGELGLLDRQQLQAGARIAVDQSKRNPQDFALWFTKSKFERQAMLWDSPWGRGYPGWHIECSAMSMKYLQDRFDIHCGGIDHVPVHHTNEIAQSEGALGLGADASERWVNYWCHGEFLLVDNSKMGKSKGNLYRLEELQERGFEPLDFRYFVLGAHYRSQQNFTLESMRAARTARLNLIERLGELARRADVTALEQVPVHRDHELARAALAHAAADLATPRCLAELWELVKRDHGDPLQALGAVVAIDELLGLDLMAAALRADATALVDPEVEKLIEERERARSDKDYQRADQLRATLAERGIELRDTPAGVEWHRATTVPTS